MPTDTIWPDGSTAIQLYDVIPVPDDGPALPPSDRWPTSKTPTGAAAGALVASAGLALVLGGLFGLPLFWALFWATP
jgi:hypothetical protein